MHSSHFDVFQTQYVRLLESNAADLGRALGAERLNVTLWLANGEGDLARWAAQDRIHRDPNGLRVVAAGHDSPWFAGQALGVEQVLHRDLPDVSTRQWLSVLAIPVAVPHPTLPAVAMAVLTVGLPKRASCYRATRSVWGESLAEIAEEWGTRLSTIAFGS